MENFFYRLSSRFVKKYIKCGYKLIYIPTWSASDNNKIFTKSMFAPKKSDRNSNAKFHTKSEQDRQHTYTETRKRVRVTIVSVEKQ